MRHLAFFRFGNIRVCRLWSFIALWFASVRGKCFRELSFTLNSSVSSTAGGSKRMVVVILIGTWPPHGVAQGQSPSEACYVARLGFCSAWFLGIAGATWWYPLPWCPDRDKYYTIDLLIYLLDIRSTRAVTSKSNNRVPCPILERSRATTGMRTALPGIDSLYLSR